jgi:hypothetical protein
VKLTELMSEDSSLPVNDINCEVTMHTKFSQPVPMSKVEKKLQDSQAMGVWKKIFKYCNGGLNGTINKRSNTINVNQYGTCKKSS